MVLKYTKINTSVCAISLVDQAEISHSQMSDFTIKQSTNWIVINFFKSLVFFSSSSNAELENISKAGEDCCLPQPLNQLFCDERKLKNSLSFLCKVMKGTKQSWLQQILGLQGRQGKESK